MSLHPIIYVRGYAMTVAERNEAAADPFCGFNAGSTIYRANLDRTARAAKFVFESPVLRLVTEFGYRHVYQNGADILDPDWAPPPGPNGDPGTGIPPQSIVVYRYYDDASSHFGDGKVKSIEEYARGLGDLILKIKALVCGWDGPSGQRVRPDRFRCYLVTHSMGGLIARALLQNRKLATLEARRSVDKLFTFATPHNGIDVAGLNVPDWLPGQADTFNRERMAEYLDMKRIAAANDGRVDYMPEDRLASDRIFCMVGTNRGDYEVAQGAVRAFVGHGSDGLVRIANASLWGCDPKTLRKTRPVATAYAFRSHSGPVGIVNSEEAYQNLVRFLFGDVRVDIWVDVHEVRLPAALEPEAEKVDALYQFELLAAPRGKRWFLSRRVAEEDSPACRTHRQLGATDPAERSIYLSSVFLANRARVDSQRPSLAYAMTFGVRVPDYQIDKRFWPDQHFEGGSLFRDTLIIEMTPPQQAGQRWGVQQTWMNQSGGDAHSKQLSHSELTTAGQFEMRVPFDNARKPGIRGDIRLVARAWNEDAGG